jgi:hypothetical protein
MSEDNNNNSNQQPIKDNDSDKEGSASLFFPKRLQTSRLFSFSQHQQH